MDSISSRDETITEVFRSFIKTGIRGVLTTVCASRFMILLSSLVIFVSDLGIGILDYLYYEY
jgi:hypothetical protein